MGTPLPHKQVSGSLPFPRWFIATRLIELREAARPTPEQAEELGLSPERAAKLIGFSPEQAAKLIGRAPSTVYNVEGRSPRLSRDGERATTVPRIPQPATLQALLNAYHADRQTVELLTDLRREPDHHEWWEPYGGALPGDYGLYISCEARARLAHNYEATALPGLLQTTNYARELIRGTLPELADDEVEKRVEVRMGRRGLLHASEPVRLHAIVDESALIRPIGGADVMREQLGALTDLPTAVTLQVVPLRVGAYPEMGWPFVVLQLRDPRAPTLLFTERSVGHSVVDGDDDLHLYASRWERLSSLALTPDDSRELIARTARKFE